MLDILLSTTRQSNPGDEFILYGVENIFHEMGLSFNPIIYNRNLELIKFRKFNYAKNKLSLEYLLYGIKKTLFTRCEYDNSFNISFLRKNYAFVSADKIKFSVKAFIVE